MVKMFSFRMAHLITWSDYLKIGPKKCMKGQLFGIILYKLRYYRKIISQFCLIGQDCYWNGDRLSKNDEKLSYLHKITKRKFLVSNKNIELCQYIQIPIVTKIMSRQDANNGLVKVHYLEQIVYLKVRSECRKRWYSKHAYQYNTLKHIFTRQITV